MKKENNGTFLYDYTRRHSHQETNMGEKQDKYANIRRAHATHFYFVELPPGNGVELTSLTLKNVPWFEKYRMLASLTFFSAAWGLTISRPCDKKFDVKIETSCNCG